ncbi:hypothetical protein FA13DRAFT_1773414 [Coprinellus micaceus]|uniref:Uncharacterized protein n=1 Tax=Coprinellus micaceus TaxID=71717 RepID=A0A4Y7TGS1_COPMI|nr:hypothetical protein FA13DRAFT_1773414 [Coprinellus micaceus]
MPGTDPETFGLEAGPPQGKGETGNIPSATHFHGPRFISNLEGLMLEIFDGIAQMTVISQLFSGQFSGGWNQQWLLQPDGQTGRVALVSLHNGKYLAPDSLQKTVAAVRTPFHWILTMDGEGRYSLCTPDGDLKLTLSTPPNACTLSPSNIDDDTVKFVVLETTPSAQQCLTSGSIGQYAYPNSSFYYTYGPDPARIHVCNDLPGATLFAAVSGQGSNTQWPVGPGVNEHWNRKADALVHISTPISETGEQSAQVYEGKVGRTLHIQNLDLQVRWRGINFVPTEKTTYATLPEQPDGSIGIKNVLPFDIYVSILSTGRTGDTSQFCMKPGLVDFWIRGYNETVLVSVGSAPGSPQAYIGRPGFVLCIEKWEPIGVSE